MKLPGSEPYTPTKLEWIHVSLNTALALHVHLATTGSNFVTMSFEADKSTDTITLVVRHNRTVDRDHLNTQVSIARNNAKWQIKRFGWNWITLDEDIAPSD